MGVKRAVTKIFLLTLLLLALGVLIGILIFTFSQGAKDFCTDYTSAAYFVRHVPIYHLLHCHDQTFNFTLTHNSHPPFSVLLFIPFTIFPMRIASIIWTIISLALYASSITLLLKALNWHSFSQITKIISLHVVSIPFLFMTMYQNYTQLLFFLLVLAWYLEKQEKPSSLAGALIGLAGLIKIWPAVLLIGLFCMGRKRAALTGIGVLLSGTVLTLLIMPIQTYSTYFTDVRKYESFWIPFPDNISLTGSITRLLTGFYSLPALIPSLKQEQAIHIAETIATLFLLSGLTFIFWYHQRFKDASNSMLIYGILMTLLFLSFPINWSWGVLILLLPLTLLILHYRQIGLNLQRFFMLACCSTFFFNPSWMVIASLFFSHSHRLTTWVTFLTTVPTLSILFFLYLQITSLKQKNH